jgi:Uma2 family endonuclease
MSAHAIPRISPERYLEIERAAEMKSEYYDGQMFAMSGGSLAHSMIPAGLAFALRLSLRGNDCRVATSDLRVRIAPQGPFVYPDLTVVCGEPQLADNYKDILLNPTAVFEVISASSEAYDRGYKFAQYRRVESLREYVLLSQVEPKIETFSRDADGKWIYTEFAGLEAICHLPGIGCNIALTDVYEGVMFVMPENLPAS